MWGWTGWHWSCLLAQSSHLITDSGHQWEERKGCRRGWATHGTGIFPSPALPPAPNPACHGWLRMVLEARHSFLALRREKEVLPWRSSKDFALWCRHHPWEQLPASTQHCGQSPPALRPRFPICVPVFPFASLFSHFSFLRPFCIVPGKTQVETHRQVPRSRCSRERQRAAKSTY